MEQRPTTIETYRHAWLCQMRQSNKWMQVSVERGEALLAIEKKLLESEGVRSVECLQDEIMAIIQAAIPSVAEKVQDDSK